MKKMNDNLALAKSDHLDSIFNSRESSIDSSDQIYQLKKGVKHEVKSNKLIPN